MKFLIKEEYLQDPCSRWEIKPNIFKNKFEETYKLIFQLIHKNKWNHDLLGISLTFYHYFLYFKDFRQIDPNEISVCCVYLTNKIQFMHYGLEHFIKEYNLLKDKNKNEPDFIKLEIEMYTNLGYDLQIKTPYSFYYQYIQSKNINVIDEKESLRKNFLFNLINDTYRKSICIYYHPKIILISCLIYTNKFLEINEDLNPILINENLDLIAECMETIYEIFTEAINEHNNNNNNILNNNHLNNNNHVIIYNGNNNNNNN